MGSPKRQHPERNAGAFLGPDLLVPVPMRTLDAEYRDTPAEPEDSEHEPEPEPQSRVRRVLDRLTGHAEDR